MIQVILEVKVILKIMVLKVNSVFQPPYKYFKKIGYTEHISEWKCKRLSYESINPPASSNNSLASSLDHVSAK